jgi:hypothetical protein
VRFALPLLPSGRPRSPIAPVAAPPIAVGTIALARGTALFAGKIGVAIFVRRFLYPGGQELQIEKIWRVLLLRHESLYAKARGCKIGGAISRPKRGSMTRNKLTTNPIILVANVSQRL